MDQYLANSEQYWEPSPSYSQFVSLSSKFVKDNFNQLVSNYSFPRDAVKDLNHCLSNLHQNDYILMFILSIFWTITRSMLTYTFFKVIISSSYFICKPLLLLLFHYLIAALTCHNNLSCN